MYKHTKNNKYVFALIEKWVFSLLHKDIFMTFDLTNTTKKFWIYSSYHVFGQEQNILLLKLNLKCQIVSIKVTVI